jgi:lysophospholipase L1-like esterase
MDLPSLDLSILWIGVNDVRQRHGFMHRAVNQLLGQRPANDIEEFSTHYQAVVMLLADCSRHVITVPPLMRGEDLDSVLNQHLGRFAKIIENISENQASVDFLDLRPAFTHLLEGRIGSPYRSRNPFQVLFDVLMLRSAAQIDRRAKRRGLLLTIDGVHLNSKGAGLAADVFADRIEKLRGV